MGFNSAVSIIVSIMATLIVGILIYLKYKKLQKKPQLWKIILVVFIGMFSFTFNWNIQNVEIRLPILPLGVWLLMLVFRDKEEKWWVYRPFAWLGFSSLFIFLLASLLTLPINQALYPKDELSTYIANIENASIIPTHPSAEERSLNKDSLANQIVTMKQHSIYSDQWYREMTMDVEPANIEERFPYQLIGSIPRWGSGVDAVIFVEKDGRGLLITAPKGQYYFRSDDSLFKEGVK